MLSDESYSVIPSGRDNEVLLIQSDANEKAE